VIVEDDRTVQDFFLSDNAFSSASWNSLNAPMRIGGASDGIRAGAAGIAFRQFAKSTVASAVCPATTSTLSVFLGLSFSFTGLTVTS
jgi:hypothetical protein